MVGHATAGATIPIAYRWKPWFPPYAAHSSPQWMVPRQDKICSAFRKQGYPVGLEICDLPQRRIPLAMAQGPVAEGEQFLLGKANRFPLSLRG